MQAAGYRAVFQLSGKPLDPQLPLFTLRRQLVPSSWDEQDLLAQLQA